jgi:threonine dehydratase
MIDMDQIEKAADLLRPHIIETPLIYAPSFSRIFGAEIYLKLENLQRTGSFKVRGAALKLIQGMANQEISPAGVVAASAGNHAQGVAWASRIVNLPATIVMPQWASISEQEATRNYGAKVILHGTTVEECLTHARNLAGQGLTFVHPFDDEQVILGQASVGLEIVAQLPDVDQIIAPIGGGGLMAGICLAVKGKSPKTRMIGVEAAVCPSARSSLVAGEPVEVSASQSIADGINVKQVGHQTFDVIRQHVDSVALVSEEHIAASILMLMERKKVLAEGAGATPLAALLSEAIKAVKGRKMVLVISGGNLDSPVLGRILNQGLVKNGRLTRVRIQLDDVPGSLAGLLTCIAEQKANVLHIHHDRYREDVPLYVTRVELELETRSKTHIDELLAKLEQSGYVVESYSAC